MITAIQCNIEGYNGTPCSLFSAYDSETGALQVAVEAALLEEPRKGCVLVSNRKEAERDCHFTAEQLSEAIDAYFSLAPASGQFAKIEFADRAARAVPSVENDGYTSSGPKYRVSPDITNAQVATLATAWYATVKIGAIQGTLDALLSIQACHDAADANEVLSLGGIFTI